MKVTIVDISVMRTQQRVIKEKTVHYGVRTVKTSVIEETTQPYVLFSCGHTEREIDFRARTRGGKVKTTTCYECEREHRALREKAEE